jgi:transposase
MNNNEPTTCDNCGSDEGYSNSCGEFQCENCGYSEGDEE